MPKYWRLGTHIEIQSELGMDVSDIEPYLPNGVKKKSPTSNVQIGCATFAPWTVVSHGHNTVTELDLVIYGRYNNYCHTS